jgi:IclR family transcriptional regulator, acetate operon repressor
MNNSSVAGGASKEHGDEQEVGGPRSLSRLLAIFQALSGADDGLSLAELSIRLESPKSSLLNLLRPLVTDAYLIHSGGMYRLGPSMFRLAAGVLDSWYLPRTVHPFMEQLSSTTRETVLLGVMEPRSGSLIYVDIVHSPHPVRYQIKVGTVRPLYANASGRVLIAFGDRHWRKEYVAHLDFTVKTATVLTRAGIKRELELIVAQGVASSIDGYISGLSSVAAPIKDVHGHCVASLSIAGPTERFGGALESLKKAVRCSAESASRALKAKEHGQVPEPSPRTQRSA